MVGRPGKGFIRGDSWTRSVASSWTERVMMIGGSNTGEATMTVMQAASRVTVAGSISPYHHIMTVQLETTVRGMFVWFVG